MQVKGGGGGGSMANQSRGERGEGKRATGKSTHYCSNVINDSNGPGDA